MNVLTTILQVVQILAALGMIGLILVQHGKGADAGAAFGGGAGSASLFGASGGANFLSRTTAVLAAVFFVCTLGLAYFGHRAPTVPSTGSVLEQVPAGGAVAPAATPESGAVPAAGSSAPAPTGIPGK